MPNLYLMQHGISSIPDFLDKALLNQFNGIAIEINQNITPLEPTANDPTYPDIILDAAEWHENVILMLSDNLDCDAANKKYRKHSEAMMLRDKSWATYLQSDGGHTMIRLRKAHNERLMCLLTTNMKTNLLVRVPLLNPESDCSEAATWHWWHKFHAGCDYSSMVQLVIEIIENKLVPSDEEICRWLGEPIFGIIIPNTFFSQHDKHSSCAQHAKWKCVIGKLLTGRANVIISVVGSKDNDYLVDYADYMQDIIKEYADVHNFQAYESILQLPMQPLQSNLNCEIYKLFENDPIKYKLYQRAIELALCHCMPEPEIENNLIIVMVLGAGRGPLVRAVLNAADLSARKVRVYIIEKNPNAKRTIENMMKKMWKHLDIHLISEDMRYFRPPEQADIIVSELLGSFADNELSPECLDCALKLLKPNGISIPSKTNSYINPIMSPSFYAKVQNLAETDAHAFAKGYVMVLKNIYNIDKPHGVFEFRHPNSSTTTIDNRRYIKLQFKAKLDCTLHGLGAYFTAVLYKHIKLSIQPESHTPGLISWFPMCFPLKPIELKKDDLIEVHFWRKVDEKKVWYEWCLEKPFKTIIYNENGCGSNMEL